jgi:hypothetical protein
MPKIIQNPQIQNAALLVVRADCEYSQGRSVHVNRVNRVNRVSPANTLRNEK